MSEKEYPTEYDILYQTLITPSTLPAILSLDEFTALFPANLREHSQVAALYRALQYQRALDTDHVRENIEAEVRRGQRQRRELQKSISQSQHAQEMDLDDDGHDMSFEHGASTFTEQTNRPGSHVAHKLSTVIPAMEAAIESLQAEVTEEQTEVEQAQAELEASISDLSDLRYGRLNRPHLRKELLESLKSLAVKSEEAIDRAS